MKRLLVFCGSLLLGVLVACSSEGSERHKLLVFAAASMTDVLTDIGRAYEESDGTRVAFSFGGSQTLAQQIASGAPADLFISAGEFPAQFLAEKDLIEAGPVDLLSNKLVVVVHAEGVSVETMDELSTDKVDRLAVADPDLAPAGRYARESLMRLGLWDDLEGKVVIGADVRVTLAYVETGNVDVAIVYKTDARVASNVKVLDIVPLDSYSKVVYPAVVVRYSDEKARAAEFLDFLGGETATNIFQRHGFEPLGP